MALAMVHFKNIWQVISTSSPQRTQLGSVTSNLLNIFSPNLHKNILILLGAFSFHNFFHGV